MTTAFTRYIALGDSISIDDYPAGDVSLRFPGRATTDRLGAASLLARNDDGLWPEFRGRDLRISFDYFPFDGATTRDLVAQIARIERSDEPALVTITAGGNDLLELLGVPGASPAREIAERLRTAVARVLELRPASTVLVGTVYDPSDGTNRLPDIPQTLDREGKWLAEYNDLVRELAGTDPRLRLADIHQHFLGHGVSVAEDERWYLRESIIEPSARGASEVRRVWLEALAF